MFNKQEFYDMDAVVTNGIKSGQHLYHIAKTHELGTSIPTIYRHLKNGYLSVAAISFPRVVKFRGRPKKCPASIPQGVKIGKTYIDFELFRQELHLMSWVELDTVIGRIGGKTVLTFCFVPYNFMFGLLLEENSSAQVTEKIECLKARRLRRAGHSFGKIFPVNLTDNGTEFANALAIENNSNGERESRLFFCDPMQSNQKAHIEKNHTLFRDVAPKGTSFDGFTQDQLNVIFSHVNAAKRPNFGGKSPYDLFTFVYGKEVAELLNIIHIAPEAVVQTPKLLRLLGIKI